MHPRMDKITTLPDKLSLDWLSAVFARNPDFAFRRIDDEGILMPIRANVGQGSHFYALNPTGVRVWELIDGKKNGAQIRDLLLREFETTPEQLTQDVETFVTLLSKSGGISPAEKK